MFYFTEGGFCSGNLKMGDKYGEVKCDDREIPYWKSTTKADKYGNSQTRLIKLRKTTNEIQSNLSKFQIKFLL